MTVNISHLATYTSENCMRVERGKDRITYWDSISVVAVVCVTLALTAGLFYWHFTEEIAAGNTPKEWKSYEGSLKDGEFWYRVNRASGNPLAPKMTTRLKRLNLETGEDLDTNYVFDESYVLPTWIGDTLYVYTFNSIYQVQGDSIIKLGPASFSRYLSVPFLYEGHLTVAYDASKVDDGLRENVRLAHWIGGKWVEGRQILLPGPEQFWFDDPERGRKVLLPRTSKLQRTMYGYGTIIYFPYSLMIAVFNSQFHLLATPPGGMKSEYRVEIEFPDKDSDVPSAMAPENAPVEVSGWEPVCAARPNDVWIHVSSDKEGLLFFSSDKPSRFLRRYADGRQVLLNADVLKTLRDEKFPWIAANSFSQTSYVVQSNSFWGSAAVCRIEGDTIAPPHLILPGYKQQYLNRWICVCLRLFSVWMLPFVLLIGYAQRMTGRRNVVSYLEQIRHVELASIIRRGAAMTIDAVLVVALACLLWKVYLWMCGLVWISGARADVADSLTEVEWAIRNVNLMLIVATLQNSPLNWLVLPIDFQSDFFGILIASVLPPCIMKVYCEGRFGITPGKWLLGLRVVRTTIHPCGFARALLRNLLYCIDFPLLLTPFPAVVSIVFSENRQRLGDRVADTIAIRTQSTRSS